MEVDKFKGQYWIQTFNTKLYFLSKCKEFASLGPVSIFLLLPLTQLSILLPPAFSLFILSLHFHGPTSSLHWFVTQELVKKKTLHSRAWLNHRIVPS